MTEIDSVLIVFFFNDTATTEIYTLALHDALPICSRPAPPSRAMASILVPPRSMPMASRRRSSAMSPGSPPAGRRSEEHTSELQSRQYLVCRLLLEKKNKTLTQLTCLTIIQLPILF